MTQKAATMWKYPILPDPGAQQKQTEHSTERVEARETKRRASTTPVTARMKTGVLVTTGTDMLSPPPSSYMGKTEAVPLPSSSAIG